MFPQHVTSAVRDALADTPVVLIHGARQTGKTTLAEQISSADGPREVLSFDRAVVRAAAQSDPDGFVAGLDGPVFIDEIQRVPELFVAIKHAVDRDRAPGRFTDV